ncbi:type II toxin-antitoxin system VapC family toxin [Sphingomonas sp. Y38-1Y]|uniref:type II toxin-antitoxin system VapC family toxin n=1 Tax=Sphingomonas sp. Y38-1Y TaxID=3078265 RepID=UPI0028EF1E1E|nr:type II toxin-antitoxin system VapC family toxin [Sphingomonas sp. Y38-1Y]
MADARFLLDANILIYVLADAAGPATRRLEQCHWGEAVTSAIAYAEVMRGIDRARPDQASAADRLFEIVEVQPFDGEAALAYASLPFRRHRFDRLIAAHALSRGLTLVTNHSGDFADIPGLIVENWSE